jgi:predicted aminopeptidase
VLVLADDEREKVKLALVDTVRLDCSDMRDTERWRFSASYDAFFVCEGARCGITGASGFVTAASCLADGAAGWPGAVK